MPAATSKTAAKSLRKTAGSTAFWRTEDQERPAIVDSRRRTGDWEGDSITGKGSTRIVTLVERKTGLLRMRRVPSGEASATRQAVLKALYPIRSRVHTITWDNGSEFAEHALIDKALKATSYFADPYSAWQRGTNENTNGLLRQYLPKGTDLSVFTQDELDAIADSMNSRPRATHNWHTPLDVFAQTLANSHKLPSTFQ